jgi:predicted signal transduction protein with EAL and GGDEF domain
VGKRTAQETVLLWLSGTSATALLPFFLLRLFAGDLAVAAIDAIGFFVNTGLIYYVYNYRKTVLAGFLFGVIALGGIVGNVYIEGASEVYFIFPVVIAVNFLMVPSLAFGVVVIATIALLPALIGDMDFLTFSKFFASLLACAIFTFVFASQSYRQRDELYKFAWQDALTGAGNRRAMDQHLIEACVSYGRANNPMSLVVLDLDNFKIINDTLGHETGDQLLVRLADIVNNRIRQTDQLFRYGGDEFTVLAANADLETAVQLGEDLRA